GLEGERRLAAFPEYQLGEAAHAVAAGCRLAAVVVVDAHEGIGAGEARRMQDHQLIVRHPAGAARRARTGSRHGAAFVAHVDEHDLVAETVHLDEGMVGKGAHGSSPSYMAKSARLARVAGPA